MGPTTVYALLPANATLEVDPITHKPHAQSAPDVQAAVLRFLHRPDQTSQSLAETIHNIALARLTNPEFNADLLRFLDYPDETVRFALVTDLNRFTFPPSAVPAIKSRLALLASDPSASPELRAEAARILPCWNDDRACVLLPRGQAPSR